MADGGEGTVAALVAATNGRIVAQKVTGPLPRMKLVAPIGLLGGEQTAVIEMASASGDRRLTGGDLQRLLRVSGNLVPQKNVLMLEDQSEGESARRSKRKSSTSDLASIRLDTRGIEFVVACDVGNPLLGKNGAARI